MIWDDLTSEEEELWGCEDADAEAEGLVDFALETVPDVEGDEVEEDEVVDEDVVPMGC